MKADIDPMVSRHEIGTLTQLSKGTAIRHYANQTHVYLPRINICLASCLNSIRNVKALIGTFNQERALVGVFSVIVKPMEHYTALTISHFVKQ